MDIACGDPQLSATNVAFGATAYGPMWAPAVTSWLRVVGYTARHFACQQIGKIGGAGVTDRTYTANAQNQLVQEMLADPTFTHLFMTEMDMLVPHDAITKLLAHNKDMASGVYFLRGDVQPSRGQPCLYKRAPMVEWKKKLEANANGAYLHTPVSIFPRDEIFPVDCAGLGCVLIKRVVFEALEKPWFDVKAATKEELSGYGSDMYFYTRARAAGFELWADPTVLPGQIDYYITDIEDYNWQLEQNPEFAGRGYIIGKGGGTPLEHHYE